MSLIKICSRTIKHFQKILDKTNKEAILIGIKGGGCNGVKYYIEPTNDMPNKLDETFVKDGVNVIVCGESVFHLLGSEIKWREDYMGNGIEFINPNATGQCGCGESWSL
jgi:iron-sulfur cluster assembly accessory protein